MFKKIVSNLPYSPALVGQLGFYAKRLRKEEATRRAGLIVTAFALVAQSFAVFQPPQAVNASSPADFVPRGVSSQAEFVGHYDRNTNGIKDLFSSLGITRAELASAKPGNVQKSSGKYNWSRTSLYSYKQGQRSYTYYKSDGSSRTVFNRPLTLTQTGTPPYAAYIGYSKKFGWFAIKKDCGNLITNYQPPNEVKPASLCKDLTYQKLTRTRFKFTGHAGAVGDAKINKYVFSVKKSDGTTVLNRTVTTSNKQASVEITVNQPGNYRTVLAVYTSLGKRTDPNCRVAFTVVPEAATPTAACTDVSSVLTDRELQMTGEAVTANGASIDRYVFTVTGENGDQVAQRVVTTPSGTAHAEAVTLPSPGTYAVSLAVYTSVGKVGESGNCLEQVTVPEPEVCPYNPELTEEDPDCQPCPGAPNIWIKDEGCDADIIETKEATNLSKDQEAASTVARASDRIQYTIRATNQGTIVGTHTLEEKLHDTLEYSTLVDTGGGTFDKKTKTLSWHDVSIEPGASVTRTFVVKLYDKIPSTNTGTSDDASYDCVMTNTFGNSINVTVDCPPQKVVVEQVVKELPKTGPRENMMFASVLLAVVAYFYARSRQLGKEVKLVRRDVHAGTI